MAKDFFKGKKILKSPGHFIDEASNSIEEIKKAHNIVSMFRSYGVYLKSTGKSGQYMGLCCFHDDHNPSLSVNETEGKFKCFGCNASGDVINLVMMKENLTVKEAIKRLSEGNQSPAVFEAQQRSDELFSSLNRKEKANEDQADNDLKIDLDDLNIDIPENDFTLNDITEYYHKKLFEFTEAVGYLKKRGITNTEIYTGFKIGFSDGSLLSKLSDKQKETFKKIGIIRENNSEHLYNCIVFPITDSNGNTVGMYGRNTGDNVKVKHLYLKGKHKGIFNLKASKVYDEIILTECIN